MRKEIWEEKPQWERERIDQKEKKIGPTLTQTAAEVRNLEKRAPIETDASAEKEETEQETSKQHPKLYEKFGKDLK